MKVDALHLELIDERIACAVVRMQELEDKFGGCELEYLFLSREDAAAVTSALNKREE